MSSPRVSRFPKRARAWALAGSGGAWRTFEVTTLVEVRKPSGVTRVWLPAALLRDTPFQKTLSNEFRADGGTAELVKKESDAMGVVSASFPEGVQPVLTLTSRVQTRNYAVDLSKPGRPRKPDPELDYWLQPTKLVTTDGIVQSEAFLITKDAKTDLEKARAIYEWIVDNTYRNPKTRGCGVGDIKFMLESKDLGGKCADLNALYVGLARASGLPARHIYGLRVAKSDHGFQSLGPRRRCARRASTAASRCGCGTTAGSRSIPPTCARSSSRSPPAICPWITSW